jgi:hypothetical protein
MRVFSRIALVSLAVLVLAAPTAFCQPVQANCPLTLVGTNPAVTAFYQSPHGVFRSGSLVFVLRGQVLTTYTATDLGDLSVAREDFLGTLGARETTGGVAFAGGFLYVSSEAGLEIFDLRAVRAGGSPPVLVSRTMGLHYRRLAVTGTTLAALFPAVDLPCYPGTTTSCYNTIDLFNVSNLASPVRVGSITSLGSSIAGFNDIAFNFGTLIATGVGGTIAYNVTNPAQPVTVVADPTPGKFLVSNGTSFVGIGNDTSILTFVAAPPGSTAVFLTPLTLHTLATLRPEHGNPIMFHPQAFIDDSGGRLITLVDELDPQTLQPARTFAFDVFDYGVTMFEGRDPRVYEQVSYTQGDEVKYNPVAVGPFVYVIGEQTGLQTYGACGQVTGRIEWDSTLALPCGGADIHGWVTGALKIANVELFLDSGSLGSATISGPPRTDIASTTPVTGWRINVNLDSTTRGDHLLRAVGTDINGNRRQFSSQRVFFPGPGRNCFTRRRSS